MRVKLFLNPPNVKGEYSLDQKRLWYFTPDATTELCLASTVKLFKGCFQSKHCLELSYFDGEEEMAILKDEDLQEACHYFVSCYRQFDNYQQFLKLFVNDY